LGHLPDFLFERHPRKEGVDLLRVVAFRTAATRALKEFVAIEKVAGSLCFDRYWELEREAQCKTDYPPGKYGISHLFSCPQAGFRTAVL
jgi:hypothetical protein